MNFKMYTITFFILFINMVVFCQVEDSSILTLDRFFNNEFEANSYGPVKWRWHYDDKGYTLFESSESGGKDIVLYDPSSGSRKVLVPSYRLKIPGTSETVNSYEFT